MNCSNFKSSGMITRKRIFLLVKGSFFQLILFGVLFASNDAKAGFWGESMAAAIWKQTMEQIVIRIEGAMMGALKTTYAKLLNAQVSLRIGGSGGSGPMFISNWQQFLVTDPRQQSLAYMNDFFTLTTGGRNSAVNYKPRVATGLSQPIVSGGQNSWLAHEGIVPVASATVVATFPIDSPTEYANYDSYLTATAMNRIAPSTPITDLQNYVADPREIFEGGNWRGFNAFYSNPMNNPAGYSLEAEKAYQGKLSEERRKADVQAVAYQGFKSQESNGVVTNPGIRVKDILNSVDDLGNKIVAGGNNLSEFFTEATMNVFLTQALDTGINMAVNAGVNAATQQVQSGIYSATGLTLTPGSPASTQWNKSNPAQAGTFSSTGLNQAASGWGDINAASFTGN